MASVLFVDFSEALLPLVRSIAAQGFFPLLMGSTTQRAMEMGIACQDLMAFKDAASSRRVEEETIRIAEGLGRVLESPSILESFAGSRGNFLPFSGKDFFKRFLELAGGQITTLDCFESCLQQHEVALIVFRTEKAPFERALIKRAAQLGIPTLQIAHAIWKKPTVRVAGEYNLGLSSDYIAVFGERASRLMQEIGVAPQRIFVTGSPYWDSLYSPEQFIDRESARRKLGLDPAQPVVLFCTGYINPSSAFYTSIVHHHVSIHNTVITSLKQISSKLQLLIRPHPTELARIPVNPQQRRALLESYQHWLADQDMPEFFFSFDAITQAIRAADVVVGVGDSGVAAECMILQRPVITIGAGAIYTDEDGVAVAKSPESFPEIARALLEDPSQRELMLQRQRSALPDINYGHDGKALQRLTELVLKLARESSARIVAASDGERSGRESGPAASMRLDTAAGSAKLADAPTPPVGRVQHQSSPGPSAAEPCASPRRAVHASARSGEQRPATDPSGTIQTGLIPTARAVIDINRTCNAQCVMCYYAFDKQAGGKPLEEVKQELLAARDRGNTSVDFTGGEPTIYPRMAEVIRFARSIGLHTCIITNGLALERIKGLVEAGCREWLVSIHGYEGQHDAILGIKGAWDRVNQTVEYLNQSGGFLRVNCTLMKHNVRDLPQLARYYLDVVRPRIVNFINFNPHYEWGNSAASEIHRRLNEVQARVSEVSFPLREALDLLNARHVWSNVRYFPFCQLKGYETQICNNPQVMFDPYEWDYGVVPKTVSAHLAHGRKFQEEIGCKEGACGGCGILNVCGGIHRNYALLHGDAELSPYAEQSDYPYHFKKDIEADIVVPVYQPDENLQGVLASISSAAVPPYNLIVASRHQSAARNRNYGLDRSRSPYIIMCDDDIADLPLGWNRILIKILQENREILAVSARLMRTDGLPGRNSANNYDLNRPLVEVPMIPTACCVFRRPELRFDERYIRAGWEDTDFFLQLKEKYGGKLVIANDVKVVHLNEEKNQGGTQNVENMRLFYSKWGDGAASTT
jgi:MoaA/NifB/PqqE/SkfB family radical SAM enzyme